MVHLSAPGVRVAGVSSAGLPGVILGHNDRIAWGFTNVGPDVQDLYIEKFDPDNPKRYQTPSGWQDAVIRREADQSQKRSRTDSEHDVVNHEVTVTRHGPIIFEGDGKRYALRWTALIRKQQIRSLVHLEPRAQLERVQRGTRSFYGSNAEHRLRRRRRPYRLSRRRRGANQEIRRWQCALRWIDRCR